MNDAIDAAAPSLDFADFTSNDWAYFGGAEYYPCGASPMMYNEADFAIILSGAGRIEVAMAPPEHEAGDPPFFYISAPRNRKVAIAMGGAIRDELRRIADPVNQILALRQMGFSEC
jgi:hypothetical protein